MNNIFSQLPSGDTEVFTEVLQRSGLKIERIVSKGQTSPAQGWYEQDSHEWVLVLQGEGRLAFDDGREIHLVSGDFVNIDAGVRHKVIWTDPTQLTIWLAIHYD